MEDLATTVVLQEEPIQQTEQQTENVVKDTELGNQHLDKGIKSARNARRLKWWWWSWYGVREGPQLCKKLG